MAHEFSGRCLCGAVEYACASEPMFQANCHCDDCAVPVAVSMQVWSLSVKTC